MPVAYQDPLDTLLSWLARPLTGVDREIVIHTLGILAEIAAHGIPLSLF